MNLDTCPDCGAAAGRVSHRCQFCGAAIVRSREPGPNPGANSGRLATDDVDEGPLGATTDGPEQGAAFGSAPFGPEIRPEIVPVRRRPRTGRIVVGVIGAAFVLLAFTAIRQVARANLTPPEQDAADGRGQWVDFRDPDGAFVVSLPAAPTEGAPTQSNTRRSREFASRVGRVTYFVEYVDFFSGTTAGVYGQDLLDRQPQSFAHDVEGTVVSSERATVGGLPAVEFVVRAAGGEVWHAAAILTGRRMYWLEVVGIQDPAKGYQRMAASFSPVDPGTTSETTSPPTTTQK